MSFVRLYRQNQPCMVPKSLEKARLKEGYTTTPIRLHRGQSSAPGVTDTSSNQASQSSENPLVELINLNTCTINDLTNLKGIGVATANEIIDGRPHSSLKPFLQDPRLAPHLEMFEV
ncbi:MAG: helix-hairpin-helix domain-containing protein [Spirulina sp. SIO3F2]|nr:helix-hairpin-helix domain-containing protein [Spirulina sp. SIO3F2]